MKMMDCVELTVEKNQYAKEGVHKGMQGVIWESERKDGCWVVLFPQCGEKEDIADLHSRRRFEVNSCYAPYHKRTDKSPV